MYFEDCHAAPPNVVPVKIWTCQTNWCAFPTGLCVPAIGLVEMLMICTWVHIVRPVIRLFDLTEFRHRSRNNLIAGPMVWTAAVTHQQWTQTRGALPRKAWLVLNWRRVVFRRQQPHDCCRCRFGSRVLPHRRSTCLKFSPHALVCQKAFDGLFQIIF
jgi:hypothetical protein